jgi:hypothetical protein
MKLHMRAHRHRCAVCAGRWATVTRDAAPNTAAAIFTVIRTRWLRKGQQRR